ncbi:chorismate-binding protein [Cytophaga aurantiaca]|uniref:chorismate-binding protein n=1 Tax=Cytophaga aurantiaca TaxID=29530 RepID=UPI00038118E5|nr:anthranilate synthase component I family protein [Cytophaga aurantiaca]
MNTVALDSSSDIFISKTLSWLEQRYDHITYLNPNNYTNYPQKPFRHLIAFGSEFSVQAELNQNIFDIWKDIRNKYSKDWLFVFVSYEGKNSVEEITSNKEQAISFSTATFSIPEHVWEITSNEVRILKGTGHSIVSNINAYSTEVKKEQATISIEHVVSRSHYIEQVTKIQKYICEGNAYEINYCIPFIGKGILNPVDAYLKLNAVAPMPFSVFYKSHNEYILSASPERFIKKDAAKIISQPIKGTSKRGNTDAEDQELKKILQNSQKEQSENTMIVDLVRNDLSRTAVAGSVQVPELSGMYTFPNVHQLISTVVSEIDTSYSSIDVIKYAFPMGSMTGAPKISAMELIDDIEAVARGPFSGTVGYMDPEDNFDFNVLIRSIFYNSTTDEVFMEAGSAITSYADAAKEYEECILKITPMITILSHNK